MDAGDGIFSRPLGLRPTKKGHGSAIEKAFRLLEVLVAAGRPLALNELSAVVDMPRASAHRMLRQLEDAHIVRRDPSGRRFAPGVALADLAREAMQGFARTDGVRNAMCALVERVGETCNLGILDGHNVTYVERVECAEPLRMHLEPNAKVPIHATAAGKLFLAFMPPARLRAFLGTLDLAPLTPHTLTRERLEAELPSIRRARVAVNREEATLGVVSVAVPVFDQTGLLAGLSLETIPSRLQAANFTDLVGALNETADIIAARLAAPV